MLFSPAFSEQYQPACEAQERHPEVMALEQKLLESFQLVQGDNMWVRQDAKNAASLHVPEDLRASFTGVLVVITEAEALTLGISKEAIKNGLVRMLPQAPEG